MSEAISPLVRVARDLREIVTLSATLEDQAVAKATDRLMPGGLAMVALAGVASREQYAAWLDDAEEQAIAEALMAGRDPRKARMPEQYDDEWEPPLQTLRFWSEAWRAEHDMAYDQRLTLETEANFLRWALEWAWHNEPHFNDFASDVNDARTRLEALLYAGRRAERTRVTCDRPHCTESAEGDEDKVKRPPRLIKVYGPLHTVGYRCRECGRAGIVSPDATHCANPACWSVVPPEPIRASYPSEDRYKCPRCKTFFDADDFRRAQAAQLRSESAEKFVSLPDALGTLQAQGRAERTIRKWLSPGEHVADRCLECGTRYEPGEYAACDAEVEDDDDGEVVECGGLLAPVHEERDVVEAYCEVDTHRVWVWWPDLWRLHLSTQTRRRVA